MPKSTCAKNVERAGKQHGKVSVVSSTQTLWLPGIAQSGGVKPLFSASTVPMFPPSFSPLKLAVSPLAEHYFYPVSTAPITNRGQINSKERY